ncbi:MAG: hypothetical protein M3018_11490, partial [Actinomycetota bacterium]|nr:hypothetical protein [Actinomycetota bacterium]
MRRVVLMTLCGLALASPADAVAAGGPVAPVVGGAGAGVADGRFNFVALGVGRGTLVERVRRAGGTVEGSRFFPGSFGVPGVANDGSTTG